MSKKKILLIEDTPATIDLIRKILFDANYNVFISTNGKLAISKAEINLPDLILLDILMPGIDGFETCKRLKSNNNTKNIPIVFMSTLAESFDKVKAFQLGAVDYITKPINNEELLARLNTHITLRSLQKELLEANIKLEEKAEERTKQLRESEQKFRNLFNKNSISLWEEDISEVIKLLDAKKKEGITDLIKYFDDNPEFVFECSSKIKVLNVNQAALDMFKAASEEHLIKNLTKTFNERTIETLRRVLVAVAEGKKRFREETEYFDFSGEAFSAIIQFSFIENTNILLVSITEISQLKKTEYALRESEERLREAQKIAHIGHWHLDLVKDKLIWSDEIYYIFDLNPNEFKANYKSFLYAIHPDDRKMVNKTYLDSVKNKIGYNIQHRLLLKNNEIRYVNEKGKTEYDDKGNPLFSIGTIQDITENKKAELKIREEKKKYQIVADYAYNWEYWLSPEGEYNYISLSCERITGYKSEEFIQNPQLHYDIIFEEDKPKWHDHDLNLVKYQNAEDYLEFRIKNKNGKIRWISHLCQPMYDNQGNYVGVRGSNIDITELKKAEQKLSLHIEQTPLGVIEWDLDFKVNSWNKAAEKIFGYSKSEAIGKYGDFIISPEVRKNTEKTWKKLINKKTSIKYINENITKNGEIIVCDWHKTSLVDANGEIIGIASLVQNITIQNQVEKALELSEIKYRLLFEKANDAIFLMDEDIFIDCNKKTLEMFGCLREDVIGRTLYQFSPELQPDGRKSKEKVLEKIKASLKGNISTFEWVHTKLNGTPFFAEISLNSFTFKVRKVIQVMVRDISERRDEEAKLLKTIINAKEEEMKRFASDIHDGLGPLLFSGKLYLDSLRMTRNKALRVRTIDKLNKIVNEAILSTKEITNNIYPPNIKKIGFGLTIKSFCDSVSDTLKISIEFRSNISNRYSEDIEISLYRVVSELVNNTLKHANADKIKIIIHKKEQNLFIHYIDNGIGFQLDEVLNSQKGMGISNIFSRIKFINGKIDIKSDSGKGSIFDITVPIKNQV